MKKLIILCLALTTAFAFSVAAQDKPQIDVPPAVLNAFKGKFPSATDIKWEAKENSYKAEFKIGKRGHDVWFEKSGTIKRQKEDFPKSDLPAVVRQKIEADFKDYKIDDVDRLEENGQVEFKVDLDGATEDRTVLLTSTGLVKENKLKEKKAKKE